MSGHSRSSSLDGSCSANGNAAALFSSLQRGGDASVRRPSAALPAAGRNHEGPPHTTGYTANAGLSASLYNSLNMLLSQAHGRPRPLSGAGPAQPQRNSGKNSGSVGRSEREGFGL